MKKLVFNVNDKSSYRDKERMVQAIGRIPEVVGVELDRSESSITVRCGESVTPGDIENVMARQKNHNIG